MNLLLITDNSYQQLTPKHVLDNIYDIVETNSSESGLQLATQQQFDLILIDLLSSELLTSSHPSYAFCQRLRLNKVYMPILVLAKDKSVSGTINILDSGADDYLCRPFSIGELKARLRALARRNNNNFIDTSNTFILEKLTINLAKRQVEKNNNPIYLRRKEFAIIELLILNHPRPISRQYIINKVWLNTNYYKNSLDVHINYLRQAIDTKGEPSIIKTLHGIGYRLNCQVTTIPRHQYNRKSQVVI